jgi:tight adherence protein B
VRKKLLDLSRLVPGGVELERRLYQAGLTITSGQFALLCVAFGLGAWLVGFDHLLQPVRRVPVRARRIPAFVHVGRKRSQRMFKFEEQFPEALDLITRAMRAGHSLTFGFQMVGDELPDPIGSSSRRWPTRSSLARAPRGARQPRVPVEAGDLPFFITAITIQRETGGNLAEVLEKLSALIRERFALYGKVRALTAIGKASANLLASMPFLLVALLYTCGGEGGRSLRGALYTTTGG